MVNVKTREGRNLYIDIVRGILIILVVIGHSCQYLVYGDESYWFDPLFRAIYMFHMPLFIGISGYVTRLAKSQEEAFAGYAFRKFRAFIVPICVWAVILEVSMWAGHALVTHSADSLVSLLRHILGEAVTSFWFLWALFGCVIVTAAARLAGRLFLYAYAASLLIVMLLPDSGNLYLFKFVFPFFQAGYLMADRNLLQSTFVNRWWLLAIGCIAVACFYAWNRSTFVYTTKMNMESVGPRNMLVRYVGGISAGIIALIAIRWLVALELSRANGILVRVGQSSIWIYILQTYVFRFAVRTHFALRFYVNNIAVRDVIAIGLGVLITIAVWAIGRLMSKSPVAEACLFGRSGRPRYRAGFAQPGSARLNDPIPNRR